MTDQTVWVVMSNDFPDRVYGNEAAAQAYCHEENEADKEEADRPGQQRMRIYYRVYEFKVRP